MRALEDLRSFAEEVARESPMLAFPRNEAVLHSYRLAQSGQTTNAIGAAYRGRPVPGYESMRYTQDILRWLTFKLFQHCPPGGDIGLLTTKEIFAPALTTLGDYFFFALLQDAIVSVEAGFYHLEISDDERLVRFLDNPQIVGRQVKRILEDHELRRGEVAKVRAMVGRTPASPGVPKARLNGNDMTLEYRFTGRLMDSLCRDLPLPDRMLPGSISLGPYTLDDFWVVWHHLACRTAILDFFLLDAARALDLQWTATNSAALIVRRQDLVREVRHFSGLRSPIVAEIVTDLTYDPEIARDVIHQPLVPISGDRLVILPLLILGSNPERNLLAIVDRLPARKTGSLNLKRARESLMIDEIASLAQRFGLQVQPRLNLGKKGSALVGEVDVLLWSESQFALALSLKWFFGPDSMHEVRNHDAWYRDGLLKHERCLRYLSENAADVSARFRLQPPLGSDTTFAGLLVSKVGTASELVRHDDIPIVTLERFLEALEKEGGDLRVTFELMREVDRGADHPNVEFELREKVVEMRGWRFAFPQFKVCRS